jgi:hypothetical protein
MFLFFPLILYDPMTTYLHKPAVIILGREEDRKVEIEGDLSNLHITGHLQMAGTDSTCKFSQKGEKVRLAIIGRHSELW